MNFSRIGIFILSFILTACASREPKPPKTQDFFTTLIKRDGTKQFSYALVMEMPATSKRGGAGGHGGPGGGGGPKGGGPGGGPGGGMHGDHSGGDHDRPKNDKKSGEENAIDDHLNFMFEEGLNIKLADTGFCRTGFKPLDKKDRLGAIQINGECNDLANDEDRVKFPNPLPKKVKEEVIN